METETIVYILLALVFIYFYMLTTKEKFTKEQFTKENFTKNQFTTECGRNDIDHQFYDYNVNTVNRQIRPY